MSVLSWILLGLVVGTIACKIDCKTGADLALNIVLGCVGAVIGGVLFHALGMATVSGFDFYRLLVPVFGASFLLAVFHPAVRGRQ